MARDWVLGADQTPFQPGAPGIQELEPEKTTDWVGCGEEWILLLTVFELVTLSSRRGSLDSKVVVL